MEILPITGPGPAFDAWHACYRDAVGAGRPYATLWQPTEVLAKLAQDDCLTLLFAGVDDGGTVAIGWADLPLKDNLRLCAVELGVLPMHRRRGFGSAMLEHLLDVGRAHGRTAFTAVYSAPYDAVDEPPGAAFLRGHGFDRALPDVQRVLDLPVPEATLDALATSAAAHQREYALRSFAGPVPDDIVRSYAALAATLELEAPRGDLELEATSADVAALRARERTLVVQRRTAYTTVAMRGAEVVAYTQIVVPAEEPGRCYQWGTLVDPAHRGHRLGVAVKVANLRLLQSACPDLRLVVTFNAAENDHMIGINELLGFRPVERGAQVQRVEDSPVG